MYRNNIVSIVVGGRGAGKTDFTKNVMKASNHNKHLVVDTFDNPPWRTMETWDDTNNKDHYPIIDVELVKKWTSGKYRIAESDTEKTMDIIMKYANNSILVLEDATRYIEMQPSKAVKNFVLDSKQRNLDIIFVFHSLMDVPPKLLRWSDTLTLFKTNEGYPPKSKYPQPEIPKMMDYIRQSKDEHVNLTIRLN